MVNFRSSLSPLSYQLAYISVVLASVSLSGCGSGTVAGFNPLAVNAIQLQGTVRGGQQPIAGANIRLFAASVTGKGTAATSLLSSSVTTDAKGNFSLAGLFKCVNASDQVYIIATGGNTSATSNVNHALMTALGNCGDLTSLTPISVNEVTTIASVYALAPYMNGNSYDVAANSSDSTALATAFANVRTLANLGTGTSVSTSTIGTTPVLNKLNALSNSLASCIDSLNASPCGALFATVTPSSSTSAPTNTIAATLDIALNTNHNVNQIYALSESDSAFQPALSTAPPDWSLFETAVQTKHIITWATPAAITFGTALSATQLDATASVPGSFVYSPALGTTLSAGTHSLSVTFTPTDTTAYNTTTASVSLLVNKATPTITWVTPAAIKQSPIHGTTLSAAQLDATASVPGSFLYTPAAGATLSLGTNTLSVTFTPTDSTDYNSATKSVSLLVNPTAKTTPAITWAAPAAITFGTSLSATQLDATASVPGSFVYSPALGTTPSAGTHSLSVTFTPTDTTTYNTATASVSLLVNKATPTITWATPAAITHGTTLSATQLDATASVPGSFLYSPAAGTTPATGTDTLSVTFTPTDSTDYNSATKSVSLLVNPTAKTTPAITWAAPAAITFGTSLSATQLDATASVPGSFVYSPALGTTPSAGTHSLSVTFTPTDTTTYNTATASVSLLVNKATPTITWATPVSITFGTVLSSTQLNATASVPGSFLYSPAAGTTPATGTDTLSVTFTPTDSTDYNSATKSVSLLVNPTAKTTPAITWAAPAAITFGTALSATQLDATASVPGSFVYSPALGTTPSAGTHSLSVTFTPTDTTTYNTATASVSLLVNKATPTITWATPAAITHGTTLSATQLDATASVPGSFLYSPAAGTTPATGTDTLSVTFTPTDSTDYNSATKSVSLLVNPTAKTTPAITWAAPAAITFGTALSATQLDATASVPGSFVYSPALGTTPSAGTHSLSVTFTPTDTTTYNTATASVSLLVNKATPTITWATPVSITFGTVLSSTQLNATASVPGSFLYSPAAGTTPATGTDTLSVTFTPTDSTDYNSATKSVSLLVTGGTNPSATNINIGTTVSQTGLKRLGMNLGSQDFYDSGQMLRNFTQRNPGFEAVIWQSILHCAAVTATSCTDSNIYAVWPANFLQGATFEFFHGAASGETGTVTSSTAASYSGKQGLTINFSQLAKPPAVGDFLTVKMSIPGNAQGNWWTSTSGGATFASETTDISPNSPGKQALQINAAGSGQSANVQSYFDSTSGKVFVLLNGTYTIAFRAKGIGGNNQMNISLRRVGSGGYYFNQTLTLTPNWQDYTFNLSAAETSSINPSAVELAFVISGANVLLDDVSLTPAKTNPSNPTAFRDEVVSALTALHPGVLRYNDRAILGNSLDNMLAPPFARKRSGVSEQSSAPDDIALGLHEFLQLCQTIGAEPYFNMPPSMSTTEMLNLMEYLGGDTSTPYGAIRQARGQTSPWTTVFPVIHLELGNEEWNGIFAGWTIQDPVAFGNRVATIYGAAKSSPYYNSTGFDLVMGSQAVNVWMTSTEAANSANFDSIALAPYTFDSLNDTSSNEAIFGPMFAEPEMIDSVSTGYMYQQAQAAKTAGTNLVIYEEQLATTSGNATQSQINAVVPSVAGGIAVADHMLLQMRDLGIKTQNIYELPGFSNQFGGGSETSPVWGTVIDMGGPTNLRRPVFLAEQLINTGILPDMLAATLSGANPTWNQPLSSNDSVQLNGAHELQTFAFTDGGKNRSLIMINLSRTSPLPVTFSGANAPSGKVAVGQLTSANITDTNETTGNVNIANSTLTNFQPTTQYSLPPFSLTVFTWQTP